jgi:glycerophosphoryl diester phosphodiesterase
VWTVNTPQDASLCASLDVDAVITDYPRQVRAWLEPVET